MEPSLALVYSMSFFKLDSSLPTYSRSCFKLANSHPTFSRSYFKLGKDSSYICSLLQVHFSSGFGVYFSPGLEDIFLRVGRIFFFGFRVKFSPVGSLFCQNVFVLRFCLFWLYTAPHPTLIQPEE